MKVFTTLFALLSIITRGEFLIPPKFQWKTVDFAWDGEYKNIAVTVGAYLAENNLPTGLARWKDKLFVTIPRWKKGVPSSLNYVFLNESQSAPLRPYPSWKEAFVADGASHVNSNATVISTFRVHVDKCDRLWVADNGVADMETDMKHITDPAVLVFDLNTDQLLARRDLMGDVLQDSSMLTSVVVDLVGKGCSDPYAYITDMGSSAIVVYRLKTSETWRVDHHRFQSDPRAGAFRVGGVKFWGYEGVSSAALSATKSDGFRDMYVHPMSSTKQFKLSTKLLRSKSVSKKDLINGVEVVGDKGPFSQVSACDLDQKHNILYYTQICKNSIACWDTDQFFSPESSATVAKDCNLLEHPSDIKVDHDGNVWILSNRQAQFLYGSLNSSRVNFRVLTAPLGVLVEGTPCERLGLVGRAISALSYRRNWKTKPAHGTIYETC